MDGNVIFYNLLGLNKYCLRLRHHHHLHISTHRHVEQRLLSDVTRSSAPSENSRQMIDLFVNRYIYGRIRILFMLHNVNPSYETIIVNLLHDFSTFVQ